MQSRGQLTEIKYQAIKNVTAHGFELSRGIEVVQHGLSH